MGRRGIRGNGRRLPVARLAAAGVVAAAAAAVTLTFTGLPGNGTDGNSRASGAAGSGSVSPSGARTTPSPPSGDLPPPPRSIPSVRFWAPEQGAGWKPGKGTRVVADPDGPLADEARLLARELNVRYAETGARPGDVELALRVIPAVPDPRAPETESEAYTMTIRSGKVTILGSADAGVFYGTRTLLQAVHDRGRLPEGVVRDRPDRPQRGLSLDIARKYYSAQWIEDRIREMGNLKLNQLQLHLSDDQAFRIESDSHPEVVSPQHLTKAQIRRIVKLAASRHITVIPEIDSPGHLGAVIEAHPELQLRNTMGTPAFGAIDISRPEAARIIDDLLREYAPLFPGRYWHLGGDEYQALMTPDPEASYPQLAELARQRYGPRAGVQDLATAWLNARARVVRSLGKTPQVWNDGMHRGGVVTPSSDREVAYWTGREIGAREPAEYLKEGWKVINLNDEYLYYVLGEPNQFFYPTGERIYREWTPAVLRGSEPEPDALSGPDRVLGGRFAIWSDLANAQTAEEVARGIRLPLAAFAQKVWDPRPPELRWTAFTGLAQRVR